jgi:hypothetical protein
MKVINKNQVMKELDRNIDENPDIDQILLNIHEGKEFLDLVADLVINGKLTIVQGDYSNSYIYRGVTVRVDSILYG